MESLAPTNAELDATASKDDDEQPLTATPPADRDGSHASFPAIPAKPFAIGHSTWSAAGSAANGVSRDDLGDIEREGPSTRQRYNRSRPRGEVAEGDRDTPQPAASASAGHFHDIFAEDDETFGSDQITSRKQCGLLVGSHAPLENAPLPKRFRHSGMSTQNAREVGETSARVYYYEEEMLRYALRLPRCYRGSDWEVVGINGVYLEDGSSSCKLRWGSTTALVSSLTGTLVERAEELVKKKYGVEVWEKWLEKQGTVGRRRRHKGGKA